MRPGGGSLLVPKVGPRRARGRLFWITLVIAFGLAFALLLQRVKQQLGSVTGESEVDYSEPSRPQPEQLSQPEEIPRTVETIRTPRQVEPKTADSDDDIQSGFRGKHIFHVTTFGAAVEGVLFTRGSSAFPFHNDPNWQFDQPSSGKLRKFFGGQCFWCPRGYYGTSKARESCINGTLYAGWYKDDQVGQHWRKSIPDALKMIDGMRARSLTTYIRCLMDDKVPSGKEGVLRADNLDMLSVFVNPRPSKEGTVAGKSIVCVKSFYGAKIGDFPFKFFLRRYLDDWKVDTVVFTEQSTTRGFLLKDYFDTIPELRRYRDEGRVIINDHRDALQRLYGLVFQSMTLFSSVNGQMLDISDCIIRAKLEGYEWVMMADIDEVLALGDMHSDKAAVARLEKPWQWLIQRQEARFKIEKPDSKYRLTEVRFVVPYFADQDVCQKCEPTGPFWFPDKPENVTNGAPKYFLRLDGTSLYPNMNSCGIHSVAASGSYAYGKGPDWMLVVDVKDAHVRHFPCLNLPTPCDTVKREFPVSDAWAYVPQ